MPKRTLPLVQDSIYVNRSKIPKKSFEDWCNIYRAMTLKRLVLQIRCLDYNESLPFAGPHMRPALFAIMDEMLAEGQVVPRPLRPTGILPAVDEGVVYERQKCGGRGQTILVPVTEG
jgi:hypothetical protein